MTENLWTKIQKIQYKGTPVFGRDSKPQNTSEFVALTGTVLFWLLLFLFLIFARPFAKKPEYKTVQIVLSSTSVAKTEKKESAASSAAAQKAQSTEKKIEKQDVKTVKEQAAPKAEREAASQNRKIADTPKKAASKPAEKPAAKTQAAPAENKKAAAPAKTPAPAAPVEYAKSVEELMAEQMNRQKNTTQDFNWDAFADSDDGSSASENQSTKVGNKSTIENVAGKTSNGSDKGLTSAAESDNHAVINTVGSETSKALEGIKAVKSGSAGQFTTNVKDSNGNGAAVSVTDGFGHSGRYIISSEPIDISEKNAESITSNLTFEITFKIQPSGVVLKSDIEFESKANVILTNAVIDEIKTIIARWTFSSASNISIAKFSLAIQRK